MTRAHLQLGRIGDILNILPLLWDDFRVGKPATLIVSKEFADLTEGCSYFNAKVWEGNYAKIRPAIEMAEREFDIVKISQMWAADNWPMPRSEKSFCQDSWRVVGRLPQWGTLPLVFDLRSPEREKELLSRFDLSKPLILVSGSGHSSPFPHAQELKALVETLSESHTVVDLDTFKAERFYDLLGLYERAKCLVAIDSAPLHLAQATPTLPVIGLIVDTPDDWYGSPERPNHVLRIRYRNWNRDKGQILPTILGLKGQQPLRIFHVWNDYRRTDPGNASRHATAKASWIAEYGKLGWVSVPVTDRDVKRDSGGIRDPRRVPYIKDMMEIARKRCGPEDILLLSNDDTIFTEGLTEAVIEGVKEHGAIHGHRRDFNVKPSSWSYAHVMQGNHYPGSDLFAFTGAWWDKHGKEFPDMLLACEAWDLVMRNLVKLHGGTEIVGGCAHIMHPSFWYQHQNRDNVGNRHNVKLAHDWLSKRNLPFA